MQRRKDRHSRSMYSVQKSMWIVSTSRRDKSSDGVSGARFDLFIACIFSTQVQINACRTAHAANAQLHISAHQHQIVLTYRARLDSTLTHPMFVQTVCSQHSPCTSVTYGILSISKSNLCSIPFCDILCLMLASQSGRLPHPAEPPM